MINLVLNKPTNERTKRRATDKTSKEGNKKTRTTLLHQKTNRTGKKKRLFKAQGTETIRLEPNEKRKERRKRRKQTKRRNQSRLAFVIMKKVW